MELTSSWILKFKCENCQKEDGIQVKVCDLLGNPDSYEVACQNCGHLRIIDSKPFYKMYIESGSRKK